MLDTTVAVIFVVTMLFAFFFLKKKSRFPPGKVIKICFNIKLPLRTCTTVQINAVFQCNIYDKNAFMKALGVFLKEPASIINFCSTSEGSREQKMMKKIIVKLGRVDICFIFVDFYCH